jgi:integration host factor subunit beta
MAAEGVKMNKSQLVGKLAEECGLRDVDAADVVNRFFQSVRDALLEGKRVEIRGFGSFRVKKYDGYVGRNPKTGEKIDVKPKRMPFFKAGLELVERVNKDG